jgi:hypothetical protein
MGDVRDEQAVASTERELCGVGQSSGAQIARALVQRDEVLARIERDVNAVGESGPGLIVLVRFE